MRLIKIKLNNQIQSGQCDACGTKVESKVYVQKIQKKR